MWVTRGCCINNYLGVNDVYLSLPSIINKEGVKKVLKIDLNEEEKQLFKKAAKILREIVEQIGID